MISLYITSDLKRALQLKFNSGSYIRFMLLLLLLLAKSHYAVYPADIHAYYSAVCRFVKFHDAHCDRYCFP